MVFTSVASRLHKRLTKKASISFFDALDQVEATLATSRYLCGNEITEADWRLFATLIRFDAVYVGHFKCNRNRIEDFPNQVTTRASCISGLGLPKLST